MIEKEDLDPYVDYMVTRITEMPILDKDELRAILMFGFQEALHDVFQKRINKLLLARSNNLKRRREPDVTIPERRALNKETLQLKHEIKSLNIAMANSSAIISNEFLKEFIVDRLGKEALAEVLNRIEYRATSMLNNNIV